MYIEEIQIVWENGSTSKIDPELSFSTDVVNAEFGVAVEVPTLNAADGFDGTVEYSSSDETVAQIQDSETGDLRILKGGTTTITATFAGNDNFKSGSASYTLNVTDNRIATSISCDPIELDINDVGTLTMLRPVVLDAEGNVVEYTNSPDAEGLPEVYFETVGEDNPIIGSFDSHGNIVLNSVEGTVTIKAVYNQFQTNDNYQPSECTFTITVTAPFTGGDVTFAASTDKDNNNAAQGEGSITKRVVTFTCSNGILGNGSEYRLYKDSRISFTTSEGKITQIEFTQSGSYSISNLTPDTGSLTELTWTGSARTVVFTASAQARASQIVVTVDMREEPGLSFDESASFNAVVGEEFTAPTLANPHELIVYYESDNEEVATVDPATGAVTLVGAGDATITATFEGDDTYSEGSASYTIKVTAANQVATPVITLGAATFFESTTATITCATEGATIFYSTDNGENWQTYSEAITLTETTTIIAKATKEGATDSQICEAATATKNSVEADLATLAAKEAGTYYVNLNNVVVTYVNGYNAYLQDASGAILLYKNGHGFTAGQVINGIASVTLQIRNSNPQLTALTGAEGYSVVDGTAPEPTTVAADEWDTQINTVLGQYLKVTGATITTENGKYYVQLGTENVQLYGQGDARTISVEDYDATYTIVGFPTMFNTTPELQIFAQPVKEEAEDKRADVVLSFEKPEYTATLGETFTAPTLFVKDESGADIEGLTITYSFESFGNLPIEINAKTGAVTLKTEGEATVIATFAGNDDYKPATASYKLTVMSNKTASNLAIDEPNSTTLNVGDKIQLGYTSEGDGTITWKSSNENVLTVDQQGNVTAVAVGKATITATQSETESCLADEASIELTVVDPNQGEYLWLLSEASYSSASADQVTWTSDYATMTVAKASATTPANNYLGGTNNYTSTRFYKNSTLTVAPVEGYRIASVLFQATTSGYATAFKNSTWTNAEEVVISGEKVVTITPTDGTAAIVATIGGTCGFDKVLVTYVKTGEVVITPSITLEQYEYNVNADGGDAELIVTCSNMPEDPQLAVKFVEADGETAATYGWITAVINGEGNIAGHMDVNTGEARTAYFVVTGVDGDENDVTSQLITIHQAAPAAPSITFEKGSIDFAAGGESDRKLSFGYESLGSNPTFEICFFDREGNAATYEWVTTATIEDNKVNLAVAANDGEARAAYFKVHAVGTEVYSNLVTINQAAAPLPAVTYSLATTITSGKHYLIVGENKGAYQAMGMQNSNNRAAVNVTLDGDKISITDEAVKEVVICGPDANGFYTIYESGYLYAASSSKNYLRSDETKADANGLWQIDIDAATGKASVSAPGSSNNNVMQYNTSGLFSCYASATQKPVYLYERDDEETPVASYTRDVASVKWGTICLPNTATITGAQLYSIAGKDKDEDPSALYLTEVKGTAAAGTPYIFKPTASVINAYYTGEAATEAKAVNGLIGSFTGTSIEEGMYLLSKGEIVLCGTGCSIAENRAYIDMSKVKRLSDGEVTGSEVKLNIGGGEDGISSLDAASEGAVIYDLSGRRVSKTVKGLYIVNGKKVSVK